LERPDCAGPGKAYASRAAMTKSEETRLANLSRKQGFEELERHELKELKRLFDKKASELKTARSKPVSK
jgi:hypothetical protein